MRLRLQFGVLLIAIAGVAGMALPCAAQKHDAPKPQQQPRQQQRPQERQAPRQERRQPQQQGSRAQNGRPGNDRPHNNAAANRPSPNKQTESMGMIGGNRPPNARGESAQKSDFNPNRPPNASNSQANPKRFQDLSPEQQRKVMENNRRLQKRTPAEHQELHRREEVWGRLTAEQKNHIRNDIVPKWQQMPSDRQRAIRQRLGVLQNMPESARNQHLNDPNFTRGMSEEDKAMLRDLSHMHVGAPDPPSE